MREKSEPRTPTLGQQDKLPHSRGSPAEHLGGRLASAVKRVATLTDSPAEHLGGRLASAVERIAALVDSLAEHLCGRMASGALRELSRFLTRNGRMDFLAWMATWFHLWSYGLFLFLMIGRRLLPISRQIENGPGLPICPCFLHPIRESQIQLILLCLTFNNFK